MSEHCHQRLGLCSVLFTKLHFLCINFKRIISQKKMLFLRLALSYGMVEGQKHLPCPRARVSSPSQ